MKFILIFVIGGFAGVLSGLFGIGGGIVLVPLLIYLLGFSLPTASGTSLVALLLPVGIFGVLEYYRAGKISLENIRFGLVIAVGMFIGTFFGAKIAVELPDAVLKKCLAMFLTVVAIKYWVSN